MSLKAIIAILAFFVFPSLGSSQEKVTLPFVAELRYEQLLADDNFVAIIGTTNSTPKILNTNSPMMLQQVWQIEQLKKPTSTLLNQIKTKLNETKV